MRRTIIAIVCCVMTAMASAQKISHEYNNVSISEALRQLNEKYDEYTINFMYNENSYTLKLTKHKPPKQ